MSETETLERVDQPRPVVPPYLWLQWHGGGTPEDCGEVCESEVTWCREKIFNHDVEYVRADEIRRALMGHRRSELFGDKGLIAASMRCVEAVRKIEDLVTTDHETKESFIQRVRRILGHSTEMSDAKQNELGQPDGSACCPLLVGDLILVIDHMPGTHRGIIGYVYEVTFVAKDKHSDRIGVFPAEGMPYRCGSTNYTTWKGEWYRKITREQAILETARILADRKAVGSEISIPLDLFSDLTDYAFDLCGEWAWKKNERAGNAKEYAELHATAALALELRNKNTSLLNNEVCQDRKGEAL